MDVTPRPPDTLLLAPSSLRLQWPPLHAGSLTLPTTPQALPRSRSRHTAHPWPLRSAGCDAKASRHPPPRTLLPVARNPHTLPFFPGPPSAGVLVREGRRLRRVVGQPGGTWSRTREAGGIGAQAGLRRGSLGPAERRWARGWGERERVGQLQVPARRAVHFSEPQFPHLYLGPGRRRKRSGTWKGPSTVPGAQGSPLPV